MEILIGKQKVFESNLFKAKEETLVWIDRQKLAVAKAEEMAENAKNRLKEFQLQLIKIEEEISKSNRFVPIGNFQDYTVKYTKSNHKEAISLNMSTLEEALDFLKDNQSWYFKNVELAEQYEEFLNKQMYA